MNELDLVPDADTPTLAADQYHLIVSPALQVAAELAAVRGDPELYNDLASMLTLRALIRLFGRHYRAREAGVTTAVAEAIAAAPDAACTMVLKRGELEEAQLRECLWALDTAMAQLDADGVFEHGQEQAEAAWHDLCNGNREGAVARLKFAAGTMATAIDNWERARDAAAQAAC